MAFAPIIAFWLAEGPTLVLYFLIAVSLTILFLPDNYYERLQLSNDISYYESLGIRFFRWFTQDGDLVTQILSKAQGNYGRFQSRKNLSKVYNQIVGYERYHLTCFAFFLLTSVYATLLTNFAIALLIVLSNVVYNIIPLLLQQYNKLRLRRLRE